MFTWISKRGLGAAVLAAPLLLAACVTQTAGTRVVPAATEGGVAMAAPSGFCLVQDTHQRRGEVSLAAFRRCTGGSQDQAVLTVAVAEPGSARGLGIGTVAMSQYLQSSQGRAALSNSGRAQTVRIQAISQQKGATTLRLSDRSLQGGQNAWRSFMDVKGHLVTLGVRGASAQITLPQEDGQNLMRDFIVATERANR